MLCSAYYLQMILKFIKKIECFDNAFKLQEDLINSHHWFNDNDMMSLNS